MGSAHEMTPTYPEFTPSYMEGVLVTTLNLYNRRDDVQYYEIGVFGGEWEPMKFASTDKVIKIDHLETKTFEVYIREKDKDKVVYICTISKLQKENVGASAISSKICSKIKK
jgi:hypothetical protein